jgi:hypothetical protein
MKAKLILYFVSALLLNAVFTSCNKDELLPALNGSLVGYVYTFDEYANLLDDHSNVIVTALGLDHFSTRTDKNGRFEFKDLPAGTYELHFEKDGFGTLKQFGIQHLGGKPTTLGLSFDPSLNGSAFFIYRMPTTEITNLSIDKDTLTAELIFPGTAPDYISFLIYYSDQQGFQTSEAQVVSLVFLEKKNNLYKGKMYNSESLFMEGEKVYFRACELNRRGAITLYFSRVIGGIDYYNELTTNTIIYPNLGNESEQYSFVFEK